jgi:hypothetical protein
MKLQKLSIKIVFIDKSYIFVDEISYLIDMIILFITIVALFGAILFLRGEGDSYGKGNANFNEKKKVNVSDKHFLL